jgi:hypothetical protein
MKVLRSSEAPAHNRDLRRALSLLIGSADVRVEPASCAPVPSGCRLGPAGQGLPD